MTAAQFFCPVQCFTGLVELALPDQRIPKHMPGVDSRDHLVFAHELLDGLLRHARGIRGPILFNRQGGKRHLGLRDQTAGSKSRADRERITIRLTGAIEIRLRL